MPEPIAATKIAETLLTMHDADELRDAIGKINDAVVLQYVLFALVKVAHSE